MCIRDSLLRSNKIAGSLELLARAIMERCGRVVWLLDHDPKVTPRVRAARITLETAISAQHYRLTVESLLKSRDPEVVRAKKQVRTIRQEIAAIFGDGVVRGRIDENGKLEESLEFSDWTLEGNVYPNFTELTAWAYFGAQNNVKQAKATYRMLCTFSHPSIDAVRMHLSKVDSRYTYSYSPDYLTKIGGNSAATFYFALQAFTSYFDYNFVKTLNELNARREEWESRATTDEK